MSTRRKSIKLFLREGCLFEIKDIQHKSYQLRLTEYGSLIIKITACSPFLYGK